MRDKDAQAASPVVRDPWKDRAEAPWVNYMGLTYLKDPESQKTQKASHILQADEEQVLGATTSFSSVLPTQRTVPEGGRVTPAAGGPDSFSRFISLSLCL